MMDATRTWRASLAVLWILSVVVHSHIAEPTQKQHLESLYNQYGENGSMSLASLGRLLHSADLDRFRTAMVQHHKQPGQESSDHYLHGHHPDQHGDNATDLLPPRDVITAWVGGFVSVTVISLASLLGVFLIPLMNRTSFKFLLSFLVALAVGTLCGDAFLHLLPHSQGGHHHHHEHHHEHHHDLHNVHEEHEDVHEEHEESLDGVWKGLTVLAGINFMLLMEHLLTLGRKMYNDKKHNNGDPSVTCDRMGISEDGQEMLALPHPPPVSVDIAAIPSSAYTEDDCENNLHNTVKSTTVGPTHQHHKYNHILNHHHSQNQQTHNHCYSQEDIQQAGIATLAWMVLMGDGLHNFTDGLAIGAAFTDGLSSGLSTSLAIFCHELPHELGDFAVLLKAGMKVRQAILYNMLSAMFAYVGMVIGIGIGHYYENIVVWIFPFTAGLFLYVALVDMLPDIIHSDAGDQGFSRWGFCLLQNAGILLGFGIMLLIAIFEPQMRLDLG